MKCEKVTYKTRKKAWKSSFYYYTMFGELAGAYKCNHCNLYHLSSLVVGTPKEFDEWFDKFIKQK